MRIRRGVGFAPQRVAFAIGGENEVEQRRGTAGRFLLDPAEPRLARQRDRASVGRQIAGDHPEERGLAGAVAPDQADTRTLRQGGARLVEQKPRTKPQSQLIQVKHACLWRFVAAMARAAETGRRLPKELL